MDKEFLFVEGGNQPFIAYIKDEKLEGISPLEKTYIGNIYRGRVDYIDTGIPAAFIEIGLKERGFLPLKNPKELVKGETIIVEVKKDPIGTKGAFLTREYSIAGHYTVYFPEEDFLLFSKKIKKKETIEEWKEYKKTIPGGLLVRTQGGFDFKAGKKELKQFLELGEKLKQEIHFLPVPKCLYKRSQGIEFLLRYYKEGIPLITNDMSFAKSIAPEYPWKEVSWSLDQKEKISYDLGRLQKRKVPLENGGELIFDQTESCVVIDVNTSSAKTSKDTKQKVNIEAAKEIPRQIRLRNLSGIILVDFITVSGKEEREILKVLKQNFSLDPNHVEVYGFTKLHLCEIGRQRKGKPLATIK
ncbi:MAG: ribonuclease E/G [Tissierellia bacterium]|nr:ribonuclease E/G [Tissierellia bacterium]